MSLPTRERGLKLVRLVLVADGQAVAPYAGAWIETIAPIVRPRISQVAPYAGAWIETYRGTFNRVKTELSLPTRERGLKRTIGQRPMRTCWVAPYAGAWIETLLRCRLLRSALGRSLRGSVD